MPDSAGRLRRSGHPHVLYAACQGTYRPDRIGGLVPQSWRLTRCDQYELADITFDNVDVMVIPGDHDQIFLKSIEPKLAAHVTAGGHFLINGHLSLPWLPWLSPYKAVPPKPFTNWMIRPANPGAYFGAMDFETFHRWEGILGQYARGYSDPPPGAQHLCMIGGVGGEGPVDWVWRLPGGGKIFMHNGDNIEMFCSDPRRKPNLFQDILTALVLSEEPATGR